MNATDVSIRIIQEVPAGILDELKKLGKLGCHVRLKKPGLPHCTREPLAEAVQMGMHSLLCRQHAKEFCRHFELPELCYPVDGN